ncbi:MAG: phosphatase PAP2 family protein [Pseudomonadota bacterium]
MTNFPSIHNIKFDKKKTKFSEFVYRFWPIILFGGHLLLTHFAIGLRWEHYFADFLCLGLSYAHPKTRKFVVYMIPFWLVGFCYEYFQFIEVYRGEIHVDDIYYAELSYFGITYNGEKIILCELFRKNPNVFFDLMSGFAYLFYIWEVFIFAIVIYFKDKVCFSKLAWSFFAINICGMIIYFLYPAAPPWYIESYGLGPAVLDALPSAAGAARFDELLGINYFAQFYSRSANVFGAMPSLHAAYPLLITFFAFFINRYLFVATLIFTLMVDFGAIYLRHHYVWDVLIGSLLTVFVFYALYFLSKKKIYNPKQG